MGKWRPTVKLRHALPPPYYFPVWRMEKGWPAAWGEIPYSIDIDPDATPGDLPDDVSGRIVDLYYRICVKSGFLQWYLRD